MVVEQPTVSFADFQALSERVKNLDTQVELLVTALEQLMDIVEADLVVEIDEALGDQPEVSQVMKDLLQFVPMKN